MPALVLFVTVHSWRASADQRVTLFVGTNDVAYNYDPSISPALTKRLGDNRPPSVEVMNAERGRIEAAADDTAALPGTSIKMGAKRLVVFERLDLGRLQRRLCISKYR